MSSSQPSSSIKSFLQSIYPPHLFNEQFATPSSPSSSKKPFVTLTFAQSLDGKIAGSKGKQIRLSGDESMELTHGLRELHDSILVGIGTMLNDDPQLNARLPTLLPLSSQPKPIILDSSLRTPTTCKILKNHKKGEMQKPLICCASSSKSEAKEEEELRRRKRVLEEAGAEIIELDSDPSSTSSSTHLSLPSLLNSSKTLPHLGKSLMIEGGATIISSLLLSEQCSDLLDLIIITIAPIWVGDGIEAIQNREGVLPPDLEHITTKVFGKDTVIVARPKKRSSS